VNIVFLGAGNRVTMAEHFIQSANSTGADIKFFSLENFLSIVPPIADVVEVINSPKFENDEFSKFMIDFCKSLRGETLVIPFMDGAVRNLGQQESVKGISFLATQDMGKVTDKLWLLEFCKTHQIPHPFFTGKRDNVVIKPRLGFGSSNIQVEAVADPIVSAAMINPDVVIQDFVEGSEVSLDSYFAQNGRYKAIARERLRVVGGEVMETSTRELSGEEREILEEVADKLTLRGPVNFQLIGKPSVLLEINPRFSGGSTASISAGWLGPEWLINEYLVKTGIDLGRSYSHVHVVRSRKDHIRRIDG
jgi:hypothetical protein